MGVIDYIAEHPAACGLSAVVLLAIALLIRQGRGRRWVLGLSLFLYVRYMVWRVLFTIPTDDTAGFVVGGLVFLAELYGLCQFCLFTLQSWSPLEREPAPLTRHPTVDIMVTVVDEPLAILRQTLVGSVGQDYPKDCFTVHVLDDGHRDQVKALAASLGCGYIRRPNRPQHAKAGNLNHALGLTHGELIAVFDVDHVPARTFLKETVGFFDDPKVAMVQTPHHFYNPDVFQRNLRVQETVANEQALFFRSLQAGRDAHNSAFFAGSGGLFRRAPLMEIGGFQTQTITEDIHTSMNLHARGYTSCYLNRVLSAGLMPETFDGYLKQRKRWAMGCIQMLLKDNPLTKRGLTWAQRIDYFGSVFYFFFGLPRLICLTAPLSSLLFGVPPLTADVLELMNYFISFFLASAMMMRPISGGSRNPLWSDVYEIAMCFSLSAVALKALAAPSKERPFEVTPKGQQVKKDPTGVLTHAWPHLITFGLLIGGLALGFLKLWRGIGDPGLPVSLWWGSINLILLTVALFVASEQTQARRKFRLDREFAAGLSVGGHEYAARITDISESGAGLQLDQPILSTAPHAELVLTCSRGTLLRVHGRLLRQELTEGGGTRAGFAFDRLDEATRRALIDKMFGDPDDWETRRPRRHGSGLMQSLSALGRALVAPWERTEGESRRIPRIDAEMPCRLRTPGGPIHGVVKDMSYAGLSAVLRTTRKTALNGLLELPQVTLKVQAVAVAPGHKTVIVRFQVESIERGEAQWRDVHESYWRRAS